MRRKSLLLSIAILATSLSIGAQDVVDQDQGERWKRFSRFNFHLIDFSRTKLTKPRIAKLEPDGMVDDFALLRGVVFGKRGRVFKERSIQDYLAKQAWYKPNPNFSNKMLNAVERANLDLIRLAEAEKHDF